MMRQTILTAALALAVPTLPALPALAAPGDGRITVRPAGVPEGTAQDATRVCRFYLDATGFQDDRALRYRLQRENSSSTVIVSGTIHLDNGSGSSGVIRVPDGEYALTWSSMGSLVAAGQKRITVDCKGSTGSQPASGNASTGTGQQAAETTAQADDDPSFLDLSRFL
ncbi:hypothetical protein [Thermomonospora amylolytica]|uniref:hypothetical protein n=1 Tax=Thermomonospora amylolytica TaxID=1411117 RepID=UPI000E6BF25D|nr:hypothetical protein [Thermomonospora amylolytica]